MKKTLLKLKLVLATITVILLTLALTNNLLSGTTSNLVSFTIVHFMSYLFFLFLPAEAFFLYYLTLEHSQFLLLFIAMATAISAQICDYAIGYLAADNIKDLIGKKKYKKYRCIVLKWGYPTIFFFNLTPLSSPVVILISGVMKLKMRKVMLLSILGLIIKYLIIMLIYNLFLV